MIHAALDSIVTILECARAILELRAAGCITQKAWRSIEMWTENIAMMRADLRQRGLI